MNVKTIPIKILTFLLLFAVLSTFALAASEPELVNGELANATNGVPEGWGVLSYLQSDFQVETADGIKTLFRVCACYPVDVRSSPADQARFVGTLHVLDPRRKPHHCPSARNGL